MTNDNKVENIFPIGQLGPAENFTGKAWYFPLVANDTTYNTLVGNVYFEPGARTNWHIHPAGQILIITDGIGYHQIKGQPRQTIKKGDVVKCPPNAEHWHGASPESGYSNCILCPIRRKELCNGYSLFLMKNTITWKKLNRIS